MRNYALAVSPVMFSSASDEWETPQDLFDRLNAEFDFNMDVAATKFNTKCDHYMTADNGSSALSTSWANALAGLDNVRAWMNPPYSRGLQAHFIAKAARERWNGVLTVALLPARTDTKAFHAHIYDASIWQPRPGVEIRLLPGRLKFGGAVNSAPFPSMIVIFRPGVS
jgi:phage N-6-adenine-methyltransferase